MARKNEFNANLQLKAAVQATRTSVVRPREYRWMRDYDARQRKARLRRAITIAVSFALTGSVLPAMAAYAIYVA